MSYLSVQRQQDRANYDPCIILNDIGISHKTKTQNENIHHKARKDYLPVNVNTLC